MSPDSSSTNKHSNKNILIGTVIGYVNLFLSIASGLVFTPWIISAFSKSSYGLYTLSNSLIALFVFDFGLSVTTNAFLSKLRAHGDSSGVESFLSITYKLYLLIDLIMLVMFVSSYFLIDHIYVGLTIEERAEFKTIFLISACFSLFSFPTTSFNGILQSYEEFIALKIIELLNKVLYIVLTSLVILLKLNIAYLVIANCISGFICILIKYLIIRFKCKLKTRLFCKSDNKMVGVILKYSLWSAINALSARLIFNVMPSILGIVSNSENVTLFSVGASIEGYVYSFGSIMGGFFLPKLTRMRENNEPQENIDKLAVLVGKFQLFLIGLIYIGFITSGKDFILWWMKGDTSFTTSYFGIVLIVFSQIIFVPQLIFYTELFIGKNIKYLALVSITKAGINLGLSFLLGYFFGALGAFISVMVSRLFEVFMQNVLYRKKLGANLLYFFKKTYLPFILTFAVSIGGGFLISYLIGSIGSYGLRFLIIGSSVAFMYLLLSFLLSFKKEEKYKFLSFIRRKS